MEMLKDIGMFDSLCQKNLDYFKQLQIYITAGDAKIKELREQTIPSLRAEAEKRISRRMTNNAVRIGSIRVSRAPCFLHGARFGFPERGEVVSNL